MTETIRTILVISSFGALTLFAMFLVETIFMTFGEDDDDELHI